MSKKLKSLKDHNSNKYDDIMLKRSKRIGNGIACPMCEKELSDNGSILRSDPKQYEVECKCGFQGLRY